MRILNRRPGNIIAGQYKSLLAFFFEYAESKDEWDEQKLSFPLHALLLLADLNATEALPSILKVFSQGKNYHDFWFDDILTSHLWVVIFKTGFENLDLLKSELMFPNRFSWAISNIISAVVQIGI